MKEKIRTRKKQERFCEMFSGRNEVKEDFFPVSHILKKFLGRI